ncbi:MAG: GNAT family N-acetyltransferase [Candidatus Sifarchaeia archaeon]
MDVEDKIVIEPADDWDSYSEAWSSALKHLYWYQKNPVFDFNKHEEIDEMFSDFRKPGNFFLIAHFAGQNEIAGVLGLRYQSLMARIRRWEPAVISKFYNTGAADVLLRKALELLTLMGVKRVGYLIKHPIKNPEFVHSYYNLYAQAGFERDRPDSIDMTVALDRVEIRTEPPEDVHLETGENYTFEDLASIVVKSFTSTPEEREIHGFDKTVTEHIQATELLHRMAEGYYGKSADEFRKIAVIDGVPVGFVGAFLLESKYKPLTGVLGPMAVLPGYRRRGIALTLIKEVLNTLREFGCEYAVVGTPAANVSAIRLYEKAGFKLACRIISLVKEL